MATIRRLSDTDVRTIFESVHHNRHPPSHLNFRVVPVGSDGLRLSPPSYEFEGMSCGALKHLHDCIIISHHKHTTVASFSCLASDGLYILMKPQKKKAHPSEQPKVPSHLTDYVLRETPPSSCPWSLSGPQFPQPTAIQQRYCYPKGDPEYSSRKGGALWTMYGEDGKENLEYRLLHVYFSAKRAVNRGMKDKTPQSTPKKRAKRTPPRVPKPQEYLTPPSPPPLPPRPLSYLSPEPARECSSPLSFEVTPPSPTISPMAYKSNFVSPHVFDDRSFYSPFRPRVLHPSNEHDDDDDHDPIQFDHFQLDLHTTTSMQELEDACWSDPLFPPPADGSESLESLKSGLEKMHANIREKIASSPESEQALLLSLVTSWARQVANDPLNDESIAQV